MASLQRGRCPAAEVTAALLRYYYYCCTPHHPPAGRYPAAGVGLQFSDLDIGLYRYSQYSEKASSVFTKLTPTGSLVSNVP